MHCDQQVVGLDRPAGVLELGSDRVVIAVSRRVEWHDRQLGQDLLDPVQETGRALLGAAAAQLRRDDDADADRVRDRPGALCGSASRVADQLADDVRIQHVPHGQKTSSGFGGGSTISGGESQSPCQPSRSAISPALRTGSRMRRSPSRLMIASVPGSSNSTGMRTAWLRLFRKSLTLRGVGV